MFGLVLTAAAALLVACGGPSTPTSPTTPIEGASPDTGDAGGLASADAAPAPSGSVKTLFVREELADCTGEIPRKCMQVRESPTAEWTFFYAPIEGFKYEEHHRYELRVEETNKASPVPADSSSRRYRLVEIVSKTKVPAK